jgi:subtilisin family serine protease
VSPSEGPLVDRGRLAGRTGAGVSIAVIDSGVHPGHPHLGPIAGGVALDLDGERHDDLDDRLGHGTAVTAAIQEKAPGADLYAVKVFDRRLATSVSALVRAIDAACELGAGLINLSLGTPRAHRAETLAPALERARDHGTLVVSAFGHEGIAWLPGSLNGAVGVALDPTCPRETIRILPAAAGAAARLAASGHPRPIPGVPPERNVSGISFAVANATGILALALEDAERTGDPVEAVARLEALAV